MTEYTNHLSLPTLSACAYNAQKEKQPTFSYEDAIVEVSLIDGMEAIHSMGDYLSGVWDGCIAGDVDFITLGHGE